MFKKFFHNAHGFSSWVRGTWTFDENGERMVKITATGRMDDEYYPGQVINADELISEMNESIERLDFAHSH